ncbi:hypothetical protein PC39_03297 [Salinisphaera sp. PC39]
MLCAAIMVLSAAPAQAIRFDLDYFGGISGSLNTEFQLAAQWRMEERADHLVSKASLDPNVCNSSPSPLGSFPQRPPSTTSCQGHAAREITGNDLLFPGLTAANGEGPAANQAGVDAPGAHSANHDDGNLNFDQYDVTQSLAQVKQDLSLEWGRWEFFTRYLYFYDHTNDDKGQYYPNVVTVDTASPIDGNVTTASQARGEAATIDFDDLPKQGNLETLKGRSFRLLDFNLSGFVELPFTDGHRLDIKVGRQSINWGESTLLAVNSLNSINPPNQAALYRPGFLALDEVLVATDAFKVATYLTDSVSIEAFYQYAWQGAEIPAQGTFLSTVDLGVGEAGFLENGQTARTLNIGFGQVPEDPTFDPDSELSGEGAGQPIGDSDYGIQRLEQTLLSAVANTGSTIPLRDPAEPEDGGQYGVALTWFAPDFNNGTEFRFYYANYHSRLPYLSFYAGQPSCAAAGTTGRLQPTRGGTVGLLGVLGSCPDSDVAYFTDALTSASLGGTTLPPEVLDVLSGLAGVAGGDGRGDTGSAYRLDSPEAQLEYPEDIKMFGISFNTSFGDISMQGEIAYRPNLPLQVDDIDLAFAALNVAAPPGCDAPTETCAPGSAEDGTVIGVPGADLAELSGRRRAFPDFVSRYRGTEYLTPGEYIRGYERFQVLQYNLGATYIIGPGNWLRTDQIIMLFEVGATQILDFPDRCELQIEGPGTFTHASPGTDGTGTPSVDGVAAGDVCAPADTSPMDGADGVRFNPTQQKDGFTTAFSWGYRIVAILRYENILPSISIEPTIILGHDVDGTAPGPGENFIEGRQQYIANIEIRYGQRWSAAVGYAVFRGGKPFNLMADRDYAQVGLRYRF